MTDTNKDNKRISIKSKTTSTAKVTGTSGKAKAVNVVKTKKIVFEKPDANKIAEEVAAQAKAAEEARLKAAEEKQAAERNKQEAAERQAATLAAMRASSDDQEKPPHHQYLLSSKKPKKTTKLLMISLIKLTTKPRNLHQNLPNQKLLKTKQPVRLAKLKKRSCVN